MAANVEFLAEPAATVPVASAAPRKRLFLDTLDGLFKTKDSAGVVLPLGGTAIAVFTHRPPVIGPAVQLALINETVKADPTAGVVTINLPSAAGYAGYMLKVVSLTDMIGPPAVNIVPFGVETINSDPSKMLTTPRERMTLESDGVNWLVVD
jgi:hypothetical protein